MMLLDRWSTGCVEMRSHLWSQLSDIFECVEEVKSYVHNFIPSRIVPAIDGGVIKSDDIGEVPLKNDTTREAVGLRKNMIKTADREYPVVHVVDPYLYPFAFAETRTLHFDTLDNQKVRLEVWRR